MSREPIGLLGNFQPESRPKSSAYKTAIQELQEEPFLDPIEASSMSTLSKRALLMINSMPLSWHCRRLL